MWDQLWQKLVQVQISIVVQSNHRTGVLLCLNNLYLSFWHFNEWVSYVLDTIMCTIQSMHTVTDTRGIHRCFFFSWNFLKDSMTYSCLSWRSWITRMLPGHGEKPWKWPFVCQLSSSFQCRCSVSSNFLAQTKNTICQLPPIFLLLLPSNTAPTCKQLFLTTTLTYLSQFFPDALEDPWMSSLTLTSTSSR